MATTTTTTTTTTTAVVLSVKQELTVVRNAIQQITNGKAVAIVRIGTMSLQYDASRLKWLTDREEILLQRLSIRNVRKRTRPDFS